jgi:hypothetical protein
MAIPLALVGEEGRHEPDGGGYAQQGAENPRFRPVS